MIEIIILSVFIAGYLAITLEHSLKIDKLIPALSMMGILWAIITYYELPTFLVSNGLGLIPAESEEVLLHHLGKTAEVMIFLMGAMTIVEIIDYFKGFNAIHRFVRTQSKLKLLWIIGGIAFVLSPIIDNLTATIILITLLKKLVNDRKTRIMYAGMIVIVANAAGVWSPIGDVSTTMLWVGHMVTAEKLILHLLLPAFICTVIPLTIASFLPIFKGKLEGIQKSETNSKEKSSPFMLFLGLGAIIFVPIFKMITHLPPYMGMMVSLGVFALIAEMKSNRAFHVGDAFSHKSPTHSALTRIEMPSILFFLGILLAVAALESIGMMFSAGQYAQSNLSNTGIIALIGIASAVLDNVPLVATSMAMFNYPTDHEIWHFIAYSAGTGGSMLIIGSAAGIVMMGMERVSFTWYLKKISWLAAIGFTAGAAIMMI